MTSTSRLTLGAVFASPFDPQTYRNLAYMLLAVPLGIAYFVVLTTAVSVTLGMSVTLAGPILVVLTLALLLGLAWVDVGLTNAVLALDAPRPSLPSTDEGVLDTVWSLLTSRDAWLGGLYLTWRALLGLISLVLLTTGLSLSASLLAAPLVYGDFVVVQYQIGTWAIDTFGRSLLAAGVGLVVGLVTIVAANVLALLSGRVAEAAFADHNAGE